MQKVCVGSFRQWVPDVWCDALPGLPNATEVKIQQFSLTPLPGCTKDGNWNFVIVVARSKTGYSRYCPNFRGPRTRCCRAQSQHSCSKAAGHAVEVYFDEADKGETSGGLMRQLIDYWQQGLVPSADFLWSSVGFLSPSSRGSSPFKISFTFQDQHDLGLHMTSSAQEDSVISTSLFIGTLLKLRTRHAFRGALNSCAVFLFSRQFRWNVRPGFEFSISVAPP